jgi:hypothetical protein
MQAATEARLDYAPVTPAQSLYHQSYQEARLLTRAIREEVAVGVALAQLEAHGEEEQQRDRMRDEGVSRSGGEGGGVVLPLLADDVPGRGTRVTCFTGTKVQILTQERSGRWRRGRRGSGDARQTEVLILLAFLAQEYKY